MRFLLVTLAVLSFVSSHVEAKKPVRDRPNRDNNVQRHKPSRNQNNRTVIRSRNQVSDRRINRNNNNHNNHRNDYRHHRPHNPNRVYRPHRPHYPRRTYDPVPRYPRHGGNYGNAWLRWRTNAYEGQIFTSNGITYIAHAGYAHKYGVNQQCVYGLVDSRSRRSIYIFPYTSCRNGYNMCAEMRRRYNWGGQHNYFCGVRY